MKRLAIALLFSAMLFGMSVCQAAPAKKTSVLVPSLVTSVLVQGNIAVSMADILQNISTKPGDHLSKEKITEDMKKVYAMGYFAEVDTEYIKEKAGTSVVFKVKENPVISQIVIEGCTVYQTAELLATMESKAGRIMSFSQVQQDIKNIDAKYHEDGYIMERTVDVATDPETNILRIKLIEGMIESVALDGNNVTLDDVILREMNSKAGTVLNEKILAKDLRRVFNLGFFSDVSPNFEPSTLPDKVILVLNVKESKTNTLNFGGGYGEREGWFGFVDFSGENLFGTGQGMLLRGQAGQTQQTYQFRYMYPWLFPDRLGDRVSLTFRRWLTIGKNIYLLDPAENEGIYNGWDITLNKPINDEWSTSFSIGTENVDPTGTSTFEPYDSTTLGITLSYDTRDNWMNPNTGRYYTFGIRRGFKTTSTVTNFTKNSIDLNQFIKVANSQVLAGHLGLGVGMGDVPVGEIFYAGGANTIRGYEPTEAKNGKKKVIANIEYRYTFNDMFQGVLFFDWGNAWNDGYPDFDQFISGKGFGLRLNTPMGPIRLDYGIGSNRAFSEGVLHFSIGHAF